MQFASQQKVAVVIAIHKPPVELLRIQLESIRAQSGADISLYVVLDGAETCNDEAVARIVDTYPGTVIREQDGLGVRGAFARGLEAALAGTSGSDWLFAFADQDDRWHPEKLSRTIAALHAAGAALATCDARVVDEDFSEISASLHRLENRQRGQSLLGNLLINSVTGMTAVFTRAVAEKIVCLSRDASSAALHDHLAAVAATSCGGLAHAEEPLVDYVNHDRNHLGAVRWQARAFATRSRTLAAVSGYHATSAALFADRRFLAVKLAQCGVNLGMIETLFLVHRRPNLLVLYASYWIAAWQLLRARQTRSMRLCLRFLPVALQAWFKRPPLQE